MDVHNGGVCSIQAQALTHWILGRINHVRSFLHLAIIVKLYVSVHHFALYIWLLLYLLGMIRSYAIYQGS